MLTDCQKLIQYLESSSRPYMTHFEVSQVLGISNVQQWLEEIAKDRRNDALLDRIIKMPKIHITSFVRRQTPASAFSHWTLSDEELLQRVVANIDKANPGYRDGVILVPVDPVGFYSGIVMLKEGDRMVGEYKARREGETPRKSNYALNGEKIPAKSVYVVLYRHDVLAEKNEHETDADYEIVSVNASPADEEAPIPTGALIANHLGLSGGTDTKMTDSEFVALLRKSMEFWQDKALAAPEHLKVKQ